MVMIRRNGKPTSCEPCRVAKVRCDHTTPVCQRCQSRGTAHRCFYHPAPLTRPKSEPIRPRSVLKQTNPRCRSNARSSQPSSQGANQGASTSPLSKTANTTASDSSQFLGSTSFLSVFRDTPSWLASTPHQSLQDEFERWRTDNPYVCARLIRLITAVGFYRDHISWYYERSRFTIVPGPLVFNPARRLHEYVENNSWDATGDWQLLHKQITGASITPLQLSATTSANEFYAMVSGESLRWEFVGLMFALAGTAVHSRYPPEHILDLGNGEQMDVETFTREMVLASHACIEICKPYGHVNDMMVWMQYMLILLSTEVLGETSERAYSLFGDLISNIYVMGLHQSNENKDIPFFLLETRKRILAALHKADKNFATLLGRPPRLPHQYCTAELPSDLADEDLFLDSAAIESALGGLDAQGWNLTGRFYPATLIRVRQILSVLREQVLELSLGRKGGHDRGESLLSAYQACQRTWDDIPARFGYNPTCWEAMDGFECSAQIIVHFEYLISVFQLHRICSKESVEGMKKLLDTSMQILSVIMDLAKQDRHFEIRSHLPWIFLFYGIPAAGALVTEIHRHTLLNRALPSSTARSEIIRTLSFIVSWFPNADMPSRATSAACVKLIQIIGRLLDDALDYRPPQQGPSETGHPALNATAGINARGRGEGVERESTLSQPQIADSDVLRETPGQGWRPQFSGDLGFELASEGFLSWLDELDLDPMAPPWFL